MLLLLLAATQIDQLYGRVGSGNWILDGVTFAIAHTASNSSSMKKCTCVCVCRCIAVLPESDQIKMRAGAAHGWGCGVWCSCVADGRATPWCGQHGKHAGF